MLPDEREQLNDLLSAPVVKHSVNVAGHSTSVSVEKPFWDRFKEIAANKNMSINKLISTIDSARSTNLSSAIRLYILHDLTRSE